MSPGGLHTSPLTVPVSPDRPLLIVDADEVLLRFVEGFERFLAAQNLYLDLNSYKLQGNVKRRDDNSTLIDVEVVALLEEFRTELDSLDAVEHAVEAMETLRPLIQTVVLSNISPAQGPARLRNLAALGLDFPLLSNSGLKGPAVRALARHSGRPVFFVDDIPYQLESAAASAPDVLCIHLIGDARLKALLPQTACARLHADDWRDIRDFIRAQLEIGT